MNKKDLNYRKKPSVIPLRSPSPDFVTSNNITPTHSPNKHQIINSHHHPQSVHINMSMHNRYKTPTSPHEKYSKYGHNYSTEIYSRVRESQSTTQRNQLISELRKILRMIAENEGVSQFRNQDYLRQSIIREQYQKLRIQNQTLMRILKVQNSSNCTHHHNEIQNIKRQNFEMRQTLNSMHERYQRQIQTLIMQNRNNKGYQLQNGRLIQLLRDRQQTERRLLAEIKQLQYRLQNSQEHLNKSRTVSIHQQRTLKDQLSQIKWIFQQQIQKYNQHNISHLHTISKKVDETQKRLQTLGKFCIANIKIKQQSEILRNSEVMKLTYEQQQSKRLHNVINKLHNEKAQIWNKGNRQISQLKQQIERLHIEIESWKEKLRNDHEKNQQHDETSQMIENYQLDAKKKQEELEKLKQIIRELNEQINQLGRQRQDKNSKLTLNIQELKTQQTRLQNYYQSQLNQKDLQFDTLRTETEKKIRQLVQTYNKQIEFLNKEIQSRNAKIQELSGQNDNDNNNEKQLIIKINTLQSQNQELEEQMQNIKSQYQTKEQQLSYKLEEVNQKLIDISLTMKQQDQELEQLGQQHKDLQNQYSILLQQNKDLQAKLNATQNLQNQLQSKAHEWHIKEQQMKNDFDNQLQKWKEISDKKSYQCKILYESLHRARSISLLDDLKKLQEIAKISKKQVTDSAMINLSSAYEKMSIEFQNKIGENQRLHKQVIEIRDEKLVMEKDKAELLEKIRCLQRNIEIYCGELKQRRQLCQALIQQKCTLEKQLLLLKKSSTDHRGLHTTIQRIMQVSHKIDDLIRIQVQRQKGFNAIENFIVQKRQITF